MLEGLLAIRDRVISQMSPCTPKNIRLVVDHFHFFSLEMPYLFVEHENTPLEGKNQILLKSVESQKRFMVSFIFLFVESECTQNVIAVYSRGLGPDRSLIKIKIACTGGF